MSAIKVMTRIKDLVEGLQFETELHEVHFPPHVRLCLDHFTFLLWDASTIIISLLTVPLKNDQQRPLLDGGHTTTLKEGLFKPKILP